MVERVIQFLGSVIDRITRYAWLLAGSAIVLMAFVISYNVIRRYAFQRQDPYAYVITCILMLVCAVFSFAYTQKLRQHIRVDLMDRFLPGAAVEFIQNIIAPILALICMSIVVWWSWSTAWFSLQTGDVTGSGVVRVPTWPSRMMVTVGAGLLCLVLISQMVRYLASMIGKVKARKTG